MLIFFCLSEPAARPPFRGGDSLGTAWQTASEVRGAIPGLSVKVHPPRPGHRPPEGVSAGSGPALLSVSGVPPRATARADAGPRLIVLALPDGQALSWTVAPEKEWARPATADPEQTAPERVAGELAAAMAGRRVLARDAAAHERWLARLFEKSGVERTSGVSDYAAAADLDRGPERLLEVPVGPGMLDEVVFTQLALEALGPLARAEYG